MRGKNVLPPSFGTTDALSLALRSICVGAGKADAVAKWGSLTREARFRARAREKV